MPEIEVPKGLNGVIVDSTAIATTDQTGSLVYRGYRAVDLARKYSFSEVAYLIVHGKIPTKSEISEFEEELRRFSVVPENETKLLSLLGEKNVMSALRTMVSATKCSSQDRLKALLEIAAKMPRFSSDAYRISQGKSTLPEKDLDLTPRMHYFLGDAKDDSDSKYLEKILIMYMEHEFNASTFALRVAASTGTDPNSAITAALATLKGPLHGGANSEVLSDLLRFRTEQEGIDFVKKRLENKQLVMGFGHRVYKDKDPRAQFVKGELSKMIGETPRFKIADAIESFMWETKALPANLDFYAALFLNELGIKEPLYLPLFACSRVYGWCAHYMEQITNNKIIRPLAKYTGPLGLEI